jgi:hypothetical protein
MIEIDFSIARAGIISDQFLLRDITTYKEAAAYASRLFYGRNANKNELVTVFTDNCGTCSTKHALLKLLAEEQAFSGLKLMAGIFKMNRHNTPAVACTLVQYRLDYIPEAHCYLRYNGAIFDYTFSSSQLDFADDLLEEQEIEPQQIADWKIVYHKAFIGKWLVGNPQIQYSPDELWVIREQCIRDIES